MQIFILMITLVLQSRTASGSGCDVGWVYNPHHNSCLQPVTSLSTWYSARDKCSVLSSTLVHVDSPQMVDFLVTNVRAVGLLTKDEIWTATNDLIKTDDWRGAFGAKMTHIDWSIGQPSLLGDKHCTTQKLSGDRKQANKACNGLLLPPVYQYACELWPKDVSAVKFEQMTGAFVSSFLSSLSFDTALSDESPVSRMYECALQCLQARVTCQGFVFNKAARSCRLLRLAQEGLLTALLGSSNIENDGSKVFAMNG